VKDFGQLLQDLTNVKPETLKLIVPQSANKGSKLITPFSDSHSSLILKEAAIDEVRCSACTVHTNQEYNMLLGS
jgi:hypothetical protein